MQNCRSHTHTQISRQRGVSLRNQSAAEKPIAICSAVYVHVTRVSTRVGSRETRSTYHGELLAEDVVAEAGDEVEQEVAAGDVAVHVQRHPPPHLLPLGHHLVALQAVVPALQLRAVDGVGDGQRQAGRHVAVRQRVRPRQLRRRLPRRRRRRRVPVLAALLVHAQEQHLQLGRLEDRRPEQPRRLEIIETEHPQPQPLPTHQLTTPK